MGVSSPLNILSLDNSASKALSSIAATNFETALANPLHSAVYDYLWHVNYGVPESMDILINVKNACMDNISAITYSTDTEDAAFHLLLDKKSAISHTKESLYWLGEQLKGIRKYQGEIFDFNEDPNGTHKKLFIDTIKDLNKLSASSPVHTHLENISDIPSLTNNVNDIISMSDTEFDTYRQKIEQPFLDIIEELEGIKVEGEAEEQLEEQFSMNDAVITKRVKNCGYNIFFPRQQKPDSHLLESRKEWTKRIKPIGDYICEHFPEEEIRIENPSLNCGRMVISVREDSSADQVFKKLCTPQ